MLREKSSGPRTRANNKLNLHMMTTLGTQTRATLVDSQPLFLTQAEPHEVIVVNAIENSARFESPIM